MFTEGIGITLIYVVRALVHCAQNNTESSEELVRKCCLDDIDTINDHQSRCIFENWNHTIPTTISYDSFGNVTDMLCCAACFKNTFEAEIGPEQQTANKQEYVNVDRKDTRMDTRRFCFKTCISNGKIVKISEKNRIENNDVNNSIRKINKLRENSTTAQQRSGHCNSVFTSLHFWGANIVIFANIIYIIPYIIVVLVYFAVPGLGTRAYTMAVICYNASQIVLNGILIGIGACILCHVPIHSNVYVFTGLILMFLTISSTFWLFVICIDMTLAITRFRWTLPTDTNHQQERKKFLTYATWTWGGSLLPTALACIAELSPLLPKSSPVRPNFEKFNDGANLSIILYVATFPALACLANTILFCYTSYKMILIQKSTKLATANSNTLKMNTVKKRYLLFLRLYLLMDTPWITNTLAAVFTDLWMLKFLRMIQPILMLLAILPQRSISKIFPCTRSFYKSNR